MNMRVSRRAVLSWLAGIPPGIIALPRLPSITRSAALAGAGAGLIRLDRNQNPYGPSPKVVQAIREAAPKLSAQPPKAHAAALAVRVAEAHRVRPDHVVLGCGAGEILHMAAEAFLGPDRALVCAYPTYDVMTLYARRVGAGVAAVPLRPDYAYDFEAMRARCQVAAGLVYICNPHYPTGTVIPRGELEQFVQGLPPTVHVVIDEAYAEYVAGSPDYVSFIERPIDSERVVVLRTFSKMHALAALRVGYAVAAPPVALELRAHALDENITGLAAGAAAAALEDGEYVARSVKQNADDRQEFYNQLDARMLRAVDSRTNFVMLNTRLAAAEVVEHFRSQGILISGPVPGFDQYVSVAVGAPPTIAAFWRAWDRLPGHDHRMGM